MTIKPLREHLDMVCNCAQRALECVEFPKVDCPVHGQVWRKNQRVLDYVRGRLGESTSAGQCILHINPGGEIRKIEWHSVERAEDIID